MEAAVTSAEWQTIQGRYCSAAAWETRTSLGCRSRFQLHLPARFRGLGGGARSKKTASIVPAPALRIQRAHTRTNLRACVLWKRALTGNEPPRTYLKYSNSVGVREAVQDHGSLQTIEIDPLDPVHIGFGPVDPAVVHRNAVWPPHALRNDAPS